MFDVEVVYEKDAADYPQIEGSYHSSVTLHPASHVYTTFERRGGAPPRRGKAQIAAT